MLLLDFGGVVAEEGFRNGLGAIASKNGIARDDFIKWGYEAVHGTGYVIGKTSEQEFWAELRTKAHLEGTDEELREEILSRFIPRGWMLDIISQKERRGFVPALLTDQTDWLYELDRRHGFLSRFQFVFNSFRIGLSKKDVRLFELVLEKTGREPEDVVFVDDDPGNIDRAMGVGLKTILFAGKEDFLKELERHFPLR
jgi:putative hydrolase of the HAD superfamily